MNTRFLTSTRAYYVVVALLGLLLLLGFRRNFGEFMETRRFRNLKVYEGGETLPDLKVRDVRDRRERQLHEVLSGSCWLMQFYISNCPGCWTIAHQWRGRSKIVDGHVSIPVMWVAIAPSDTGSASYLRRYELSGPATQLTSREDVFRLHARYSPLAYLVAPNFVILAPHSGMPTDTVPDNVKERCEG